MEKQYYTPEISEFHVGLEYEFKSHGIDEEWERSIIKDLVQISNINRYYDKDKEDRAYDLRVKYLDREDIKSLGWKWNRATNPFCFHYTKNQFYITHSFDPKAPPKYHALTIDLVIAGKHRQYFRGFIKNKSELKKLMQQLGIQS